MPESALISAHASAAGLAAWWALPWPPLAGLTVAGVGYAVGWRRIAKANRSAAPVPRRVAAFYGGLVLLCAALVSPLDRLSETLFSAHMVQHLIIILAASPMLVYGAPVLPFVLAAPRALRRWSAARTRGPAARRLTAWIWGGVAAGLLHTTVLWLWHLPGPYQAALSDPAVHAAEHLSFLATALLFWRLVIGAGGRRSLGYAPAAGLVLATGLQSSALGAILSFATYVLYPAHAAGAAEWGLSGVEDQQLAGAIMWIPAGAVYLITIVVLVVRAFEDAERRMLGKQAVRGGPAAHAGGRQ